MTDAGAIVDLAFRIEGDAAIALDHAEALWLDLLDSLPWAAAEPLFAVHPLARVSETGDAVLLSRHSRLTLRLPATLADVAAALAGQRLARLGASLAEPKLRPLAPAVVLYSSFVHLGPEDEASFVAACTAELAALAPEARIIPGKARRLTADGRRLAGYSVMVHGIADAASLAVQHRGLGSGRRYGCGVFVPHKSITAVAL